MTVSSNPSENEVYEQIDFSDKNLGKIEFYQCSFIGCNFTRTDLRKSIFEECVFKDCIFSMTKMEGISLRNIAFEGCKLLGIDFTQCNKFMFTFNFDRCILDFSIFEGTKLKNTPFISCSLKEVDFSASDLTKAVFTDSNLTFAIFDRSILEKADFRNAIGFSIDPEINKMKGAKFSVHQLEGLLSKYQLDID